MLIAQGYAGVKNSDFFGGISQTVMKDMNNDRNGALRKHTHLPSSMKICSVSGIVHRRILVCVRSIGGWGGSSPNIDKDSPYTAILQSRNHARLRLSNGFLHHTF